MAKKVKLENYIHIQNGYAFKSNLFQNFGVPVVRITNVENGKLNLDKVVYYSEDKKLDKFFIKNNDILLSLTGDDKTLKVCINESDEKLYLNQRVAILRSNESLVQKYLYYSIKKYSLLILEKAKGIAQKNISVDDINSLEISLPDLDEQKQIAKTLDKAQELIDLRKESIAKLDELAKSIFIDMFGDPVSNPKGWEKTICINEATCIVPGRDKPKSFTGETKWLTTSDLNNLGFINTEKIKLGLSQSEIDLVRAKIIPINSVVFTCVGDLGIVSILKNNVVMNQQLHSFQCSEKLNNIFLMFNISHQKGYMYKYASQTTVPYMNKTVCNNIPLILPPIDLQNKFATIIEKIEEQKSLYEKELEKLEENFQALLQQSFKE